MPQLKRPQPPIPSAGRRALVSSAPAGLGDPFEVTVDELGDHLAFEIERWSARGITIPAVGDECLVVEDETGEPWVPAWWPAGGDLPIGGGGGGGAVDSVNGEIGDVVLGAADVGAQPLDGDLTALATLNTQAFGRGILEEASAAAARAYLGLGSASVLAAGAAGGVATLDGGGKVPSGQLPAIAITSITEVGSQATQLALAAQEGDVAVRSDENKSYVHNGGSAGTMADWNLLRTPTDAVLSVNGMVGAVALTAADVAAIAKATLTAKGSILAASAASTPAEIPIIGTDGLVLQEDAASGPGAKYGKVKETAMETAAAGLAKGAFSAYRHAALAVAPTGTMLACDTEDFDVSGWFNVANGRYTPQVAGYYRLSVVITLNSVAAGKQVYCEIFKNGVLFKYSPLSPTTSIAANIGTAAAWVVQANGSTDYFEIQIQHTDGVNRNLFLDTGNSFSGELVGRS